MFWFGRRLSSFRYYSILQQQGEFSSQIILQRHYCAFTVMDYLSQARFYVSESSIIEISGTVVALMIGKKKQFMKYFGKGWQ